MIHRFKPEMSILGEIIRTAKFTVPRKGTRGGVDMTISLDALEALEKAAIKARTPPYFANDWDEKPAEFHEAVTPDIILTLIAVARAAKRLAKDVKHGG